MSKYEFMAEGELESERLKALAIDEVMAELEALDFNDEPNPPVRQEPGPIVIRTKTWDGACQAMERRSLMERITRSPRIYIASLDNEGNDVLRGVSHIDHEPLLSPSGGTIVRPLDLNAIVIHEVEPLRWYEIDNQMMRNLPLVVRRSPSMGNVVRGFSISGVLGQCLIIHLGVSFEWSDLVQGRLILDPVRESRRMMR